MKDAFLRNAYVCRDGMLRQENIRIEQGRFAAIGKDVDNPDHLPELSAQECFAVPGFFDVHTHGAVHVDVNAAQEDDLCKMARFFATQGTTRWLASILTDTPDQTLRCIEIIRRTMAHGTHGAALMGIHLEGPFLSPDYKGAMPEALLRNGDAALLETYQRAAGDALRYLTLAPEVEGVPELVSALQGTQVRVALGHSGATYAQTMDCIRRGATAVTHTFNGMRLFHQHEPAIMGAALESDVWCEAICDGRHLHPGTVRMLTKCKGVQRVLAITDSMMAAGLPDGPYKLGVNDILVTDGDAMLADGSSRAGSTLTMGQALKNLMRFTDWPLEKVMPMMCLNQAEMLGLDSEYGSINVGKAADIVLLNADYDVLATFVAGELVYRAPKTNESGDENETYFSEFETL